MSVNTMLDAVTANTTSSVILWRGGKGTFVVTSSDFGSGTCTLEFSADNTTFVSAGASFALTTSGTANFELAAGGFIRVVLSGATTPAALTASVIDYRAVA